jgi:hypothetical protein
MVKHHHEQRNIQMLGLSERALLSKVKLVQLGFFLWLSYGLVNMDNMRLIMDVHDYEYVLWS